MIFGYFDESGEKQDAFIVVAGFVGRKDDWKKFIKLWRKEMGNRPPLHLEDMRLGSPVAARRYGDLLHRLGTVPSRSNLRAFAGSVPIAQYTKRIKRTVAEIGLAGYNVAVVAMLNSVLESKRLPKREQIEFTFEDQLEFAIPRAASLHGFRQIEKYKTCHGRSRVGKDSSIPKSILLEASDYLAYAILQQLINPESPKAKLTAPILNANQPIEHTEINKENVDHILNIVYGEEIPAMDQTKRHFIVEKLRESIKAR